MSTFKSFFQDTRKLEIKRTPQKNVNSLQGHPIAPLAKSFMLATKYLDHKFIATPFRPIKEVTVTFASNLACPHLGAFFHGEKNER